jgi:PAS domain S-box-containing protein
MIARRPFYPELTASLVALAVLAVSAWVLILVPRLGRGYPLAGLVGLVTVGAVIAFGLALFLESSLRARLRLIRTAIYQLIEGNFSDRLDSTGRDEVSATMRAVDYLAGAFQARLEAARLAERRYRLLFEHNPAGMFRTRPDGRVVECNPAAVAMLGYASALDVKTRHASSFYADPSDRDLVLQRLAREDVLANVKVRFRRKDGREIPVLLNISRTSDLGETYLEGQFVDLGDDAEAQEIERFGETGVGAALQPALGVLPGATS